MLTDSDINLKKSKQYTHKWEYPKVNQKAVHINLNNSAFWKKSGMKSDSQNRFSDLEFPSLVRTVNLNPLVSKMWSAVFILQIVTQIECYNYFSLQYVLLASEFLSLIV